MVWCGGAYLPGEGVDEVRPQFARQQPQTVELRVPQRVPSRCSRAVVRSAGTVPGTGEGGVGGGAVREVELLGDGGRQLGRELRVAQQQLRVCVCRWVEGWGGRCAVRGVRWSIIVP